jgi:hypothetical protein
LRLPWGRGVYFVVNGGGHKDENVSVGRAIFVEHDNLDKEIQRELWKTLELPSPTFQVDTGGKSIHSYWVFDRPTPLAQWRELQRDLLEFADGDRVNTAFSYSTIYPNIDLKAVREAVERVLETSDESDLTAIVAYLPDPPLVVLLEDFQITCYIAEPDDAQCQKILSVWEQLGGAVERLDELRLERSLFG